MILPAATQNQSARVIALRCGHSVQGSKPPARQAAGLQAAVPRQPPRPCQVNKRLSADSPSMRRSLCSNNHIWIFCLLCRNLKIRFCGRAARTGGRAVRQSAGVLRAALAALLPHRLAG